MSYHIEKQIRAQDRPLSKTCWGFLFQKFNLCVNQSHREADKSCQALEQSLQYYYLLPIPEQQICKAVIAWGQIKVCISHLPPGLSYYWKYNSHILVLELFLFHELQNFLDWEYPLLKSIKCWKLSHSVSIYLCMYSELLKSLFFSICAEKSHRISPLYSYWKWQ